MSALRIAIATLADEGVSIDSEVDGNSLRPEGAGEIGIGPVKIQGELSPLDDEFLFQGFVSATYTGTCDRCLEPVTKAYTSDVVLTFVPGSPDADDDELDGVDADETATFFEGPELDLGARTWEELVLAQPSKMLCRESCKGLCVTCGENLNEGPCGCRADKEDEERTPTRKSLAGLGELFPDLKPGVPED